MVTTQQPLISNHHGNSYYSVAGWSVLPVAVWLVPCHQSKGHDDLHKLSIYLKIVQCAAAT